MTGLVRYPPTMAQLIDGANVIAPLAREKLPGLTPRVFGWVCLEAAVVALMSDGSLTAQETRDRMTEFIDLMILDTAQKREELES